MGTCYSKSGQELDASYKENRPREKKKGSHKNGHANSRNNPKLVVEDFDSIQNDVSDTVYTEDSHTILTLDINNCMNKSQQTSLDQLAKDANKNIEYLTGYSSEIVNHSSLGSRDNENTVAEDSDKVTDVKESMINSLNCDNAQKGKVVESDSGIVVEHCDNDSNEGCESHETDNKIIDKFSENNKSNIGNKTESLSNNLCKVKQKKPLHLDLETVHSCSCSNSNLNDSRGCKPHLEHSSSASCHESENRRSLASLDRLSESHKSTDSSTDLDKIKLAIRQSSVSSPTEQRSFADSCDGSYEMSSAMQQPEVITMNMNGREVVVIDSELFSQIIDEIQFLKMKLSQLTEVIQDAEDAEGGTSEGVSILSSSA